MRLKSTDFENLEGIESNALDEDLGNMLKSISIEFHLLAEGRRRPASEIK